MPFHHTLVTPSRPDLPTIEDVSRRGLLSIVLTTAAFVACGGDEKVGEGTPAASARFPRTVSHGRGATTIAAEPQRIVAMTGFAELDSLLVLGVKPIAARRRFTDFLPWVREAGVDGVQGIPEELQSTQIDMELVASLRPDLLLGSDALITEESYGRFSAIAPTIATSGADWRQTLAVTADAVSRTDEGSRVAAEADHHGATQRSDPPRYDPGASQAVTRRRLGSGVGR